MDTALRAGANHLDPRWAAVQKALQVRVPNPSRLNPDEGVHLQQILTGCQRSRVNSRRNNPEDEDATVFPACGHSC